jgi:trehalose synthase
VAKRIRIEQQRSLEEHEQYEHLAHAVRALRAKAKPVAESLQGRTVWMVNSTAHGGGVSELLPGIVAYLNELGIHTEWVVIEAQDPAFFALTKRIHNLIHGDGTPDLDEDDRACFEAINRANADQLRAWLSPGDILIVHDPQPMPIASMLRADLDLICIWRCHIGLDEHNAATKAAWRFLRPYAEVYQHAVFSAPEYVVSYFEGRSSIMYPSIDPLSEKNQPLEDPAIVLARAGLLTPRSAVEPFEHQVQRLQPDGRFAGALEPDDIGLFERPIITQVSRWDRLKGFLPLLRGFTLLKQQERPHDDALRRRLDDVRLLLVGPDPESIADDPEGSRHLEELCAAWCDLDDTTRADIALVTVPMADPAANALIINAIQRAATVVVQNSLREGFGLTITEAMWKGLPVLSNTQAVGPRQQIRSGTDGLLINEPESADEIAHALAYMLSDPERLERWGHNARERVRGHFLVYTQLRRKLRLIGSLAGTPIDVRAQP